MFLIHSALGEDAKMFDIDEEPSASGLFSKINSNPENDDELNISTVIRNDYAAIIENHPDVIKRISQFPNRTKTAKLYTEDNTVVLRKKGMALFSIVSKNINGKATIEEKTFPELIQFAKCPPEEERQNLTKEFWTAYELIKVFKPKNASGNSDLSLDTKSLISLRDLAKVKRDDIDLELISFINTLVTDIKKYKTLSKFTLRKLTLSENKNIEPYGELINNIKELRKKLGVDYLDIILKRADGIENDVIIAIQNKISV